MKQSAMLTIASLLSILLATIHVTDDIVRGVSGGGLPLLFGVVVLVGWLYGTLVLAERRSGYVIVLLGSLLGFAIPILHMAGKGIQTAGSAFFVWTDIALEVTALFAVILAVRGLMPANMNEKRST